MTVKELRDKLNEFDDDLIVMVPNENLYLNARAVWYVAATNVTKGVNELDGCVFINDYVEDQE